MIVSAMKKPKYRLSPNEVERLVKEERERLRKLRIVQVREQAKANAALIRNQVKNEKNRLLADFADEVENEVLAEKEEKIRKLEQKYDSTLRSIGEGHAEVLLHGDGQQIAERLHKRLEDEDRAMERYKAAREKHDREKAQEEWDASRNIRNRNLALEAETKRAAYVASLPPPKSDNISFDDKPTQKKAIQMTDMKSFAATHYHIPDYQVVKAGPDEQLYDAKADAEQADKRLKQDLKEKKISLHEQVEKARIRGNEALHKEMLKHDLSDMMKDLSLLQRKDRRRRQALLAEVPSQVFVPPERCLQDREDHQVEMERQFEEMYMDKLQKPDASTLQTWSELPTTGDDTTTNDDDGSQMSTLDSVPLPPSEMALRDFTTDASSSKKSGTGIFSRKPDTVLKQLLNKIKEQRMNVLANQKQDAGSVLTNEKPGKDVDAVSLTSASGSRASWKRSMENVDEESLDDLPVSGHGMMGRETDVQSMESGETGSSGSKVLHENNALVEELTQRIKKIEDQKVHLAHQLHSQSEFYQELQKQQQELQNLKLFPPPPPPSSTQRQAHQRHTNYDNNKDTDNEHTLEDVSIPSRADDDDDSSIHGVTDSSYFKPRQQQQPHHQQQQPVDLADAMSKLRPVAGILKGTRNPEFELLTSNGFLPPQSLAENEIEGGRRKGFDCDSSSGVGGDRDCRKASDDLMENMNNINVNDKNRNILLQLDSISPLKEGGARRMIDFGGGVTTATTRKSDAQPLVATGHLNLSGRSVDSDKSDGVVSTNVKAESRGGRNSDEDPMRRKVQAYHSRAQELQASMDESTLNKVRDYQQHILQTHQDRKQLLENIRDDIEQRRQALYSSTSKFVGNGGGAFLMNLGVGGRDGTGSSNPSSVRGQISLPPRLYSSSMSGSSSYPMLSSGVEAYANTRPFLSHSQSDKTLEPIKPFIADPWISNKNKKTQASILKQSSGSGSADFQGQYDLSKAGVVGMANQGPPSSIEKIRKSLAFDDLNESNVDVGGSPSPAFFRGGGGGGGGDSLNDTSASRHSQAFTDDSKLTTSEEDRGSPILPGGSRSWDTSDNKSNNSVTGSSSLNGSALVARAEERREGFERRQQELRGQLMDIQHQKEAILMRYYKGQQAIQDQQTVLRNRLLLPQHPSSSVAAQSHQFQTGSGGGSSDGGSGAGTGSFGNDRLSGKSSKSSGSSRRESLNLTGDDYLEEISYHQVKGTDEPMVPLNLPESSSGFGADYLWQKKKKSRVGGGGGGQGVVTFADEEGMRRNRFEKYDDEDDDDDIDSSSQLPAGGIGMSMSTWASVLSSNKPSTSSNNVPSSASRSWNLGLGGNEISVGSGIVEPLGVGEVEDGNSSGQSRGRVDAAATFSSSSSANSSAEERFDPTASSQTPEHGNLLYHQHHHHQPHELSTILEVDTPTATDSVAGSSARFAPASASQSLQSLYSQSSAGAANAFAGSGSLYPSSYLVDFEKFEKRRDLNQGGDDSVVIDRFPDLPRVLPVSTSGGGQFSSSSAMLSHQGYNLGQGMMAEGEGFEYYDTSVSGGGGGDMNVRGEGGGGGWEEEEGGGDYGGGGITLTDFSLGGAEGSSVYTLESEPADVESNLDTSGGFDE